MKKLFMYSRSNRWTKNIAILLLLTFVQWIAAPTVVLALTGGPSQPEVQSFEPVGTDQMVDPFSGDFTYNIPLLEVGGYPINLSYNGGVSMDQEASWVGLGWNINPGVINRNLRGLPDDFDGDEIVKKFSVKPNRTYGASSKLGGELFGVGLGENLSLSFGISFGMSYNNYRGVSVDFGLEPSISGKGPNDTELTGSLGLRASAAEGMDVSPSVSVSKKYKESTESKTTDVLSSSIGSSYNSRSGLKAITFGASAGTERKQENKRKKERTKSLGSVNGGSSISFASPVYSPSISMPMNNLSVSLGATGGGELFGAHAKLSLTGYYSGQFLTSHELRSKAYGVMNLQHAQDNEDALMDFTREKDGSFTKNTPDLYQVSMSYDPLSVSGQGIGGNYRLMRNDVGILRDNKMKNVSGGLDLNGIEIGAGNSVHGGVNFTVNGVTSTAGRWDNDNMIKSRLRFQDFKTNDPFFEPYYYKQAGEKTTRVNEAYFTSLGAFEPIRISISEEDANAPARSKFEMLDMPSILNPTTLLSGEMYEDINLSNELVQDERERRNENITILRASEAANYGIETTIRNYTLNDFGMTTLGVLDAYTSINREDAYRKAHHISEIRAQRTDGVNYIYGIPAYNIEQRDVTFTVDATANKDWNEGLVTYTATNASLDNDAGLDNLFNETTTPAYAHSYLLTAIISDDYRDKTNNGLSDDDIGSFTKFNYSMIEPGFEWRVPMQSMKANYSYGMVSANTNAASDDKGSYVYGKKEVWLLHSIETKTHIAEFHVSDRSDMGQVSGVNGGVANSSIQKLDKIVLYSKKDRIDQENGGDPAVPLKTVHFVYETNTADQLCNGIDNLESGSGGKLTLKEVYFTYGNSNRAKLNAYTFHYGQVFSEDGTPLGIVNPSYNMKSYDRWGSYLENKATGLPGTSGEMGTGEYPYTTHETSLPSGYSAVEGIYDLADFNAHAWNLSQIDLPHGGQIKVFYESDDYAFVQDKHAMRMFKLVDIIEAGELAGFDAAANPTYANLVDFSDEPVPYLVIQVDRPIPSTSVNPELEFRDAYLKRGSNYLEQVFFKSMVRLGKPGTTTWEYVNGWMGFDDPSSTTTMKAYSSGDYGTNFDIFAIKVKVIANPDISSGVATDLHPISYAALNFNKLYQPRIAYDLDDPTGMDLVSIANAMVSSLASAVEAFKGVNGNMISEDKCIEILPQKSWLRLYNPDGFKNGGGHRVHKVTMSDQWKAMTGNNDYINQIYGQEYDYTTQDENGNTISSGVAAYEPLIGGEENPWRQPVFYEETNVLKPNDQYFKEAPYGESFFPGPSVGYRKVTIRNITPADITRHATGKVAKEFYTAYDYPTITKRTSLATARKKPNPVLKLLKLKSKDYLTMSQGFVIELNDMHGKPKAEWVYQEAKSDPISGIEYFYKESGHKRLNNEVLTLAKDGSINQNTIGIDVEVAADMREHLTKSTSGGANGNLETFLAAVLPCAIPTVLPKYASEETRFRSAVVTKVINRYGLVDRVVQHDLGASIATSNLLYDEETGEVLLTETTNQFKDEIYNFTYPAHFAYNAMGPAYTNAGIVVSQALASSMASSYFFPGDEVMIGTNKAWYMGGSSFIDASGFAVSVNADVKVLRSGKKNMQNTPVGQIVSKKNPIVGTGLLFDKVVSATAVEYKDKWPVFCDCELAYGDAFNPYLEGLMGNWRPYKEYLPLTQRSQTLVDPNTGTSSSNDENVNSRHDGVLLAFSPFWNQNAGNAWTPDISGWTFSQELSRVTPYGRALESKDALGNYSAETYGYQHQLVTSVSANAQYREVGCESFEDHGFKSCDDRHFTFDKSVKLDPDALRVTDQSHTGQSSLKVLPNGSVFIERVVDECQD